VRRTLLAAAPLTIQPLPDELLAAWFAPLHDRRIRIDLPTVLQGISAEHTLAAAERLRSFDRPTLIAWGTRDRFFPLRDESGTSKSRRHLDGAEAPIQKYVRETSDSLRIKRRWPQVRYAGLSRRHRSPQLPP
jgi:pimeloyl-ACP methyl ester carboxylesterase